MYQQHFGLYERPFAITPDPGYLFLSAHHEEALAHLLYGVRENGVFVQLTGEVGTGKTTLIRSLLERYNDGNEHGTGKVDVALCLNPALTVQEFVATVCDELRIPVGAGVTTLKPLIDALNRHLLATHSAGRQTVLIVDEAQNLSRDVLEQLRLLTNLETHRHKLLRVILVGQPELARQLSRPELRQLAQRVTARYHLRPLRRAELGRYVGHRLATAGGDRRLFSAAALALLYRHSRGVPRLINIVCDRALLGAYVRGKHRVGRRLLAQATAEVLPAPPHPSTPTRRVWLRPALLAGGVAALLPALPPPAPLPAGPLRLATELAAVPPAQPKPSATPPAAPPQEAVKSALPVTPTALPATPATKPGNDASAWPALLTTATAAGALRQLLALWRQPGDGDIALTGDTAAAPSCRAAPARLRCLSDSTDWDGLRRYNRPAMLRLIEPAAATERWVLLRALGAERALVTVNDTPVELSLTQLDAYWSGEFLLFWRPPLAQTLIGPGSSGAPVLWLRHRLALAEQRPPPNRPAAEFDSSLQNRVRNFQRLRDLDVDGLVGSRTMLLLDNLAPRPDTPLLTEPPRA